jgi:hypothetical protein
MTLGPRKEHPMKAKREQQSPPEDIERFRAELSLKIQRLVAESLEAWSTCDNVRCRRAKRCASEDRECIAKSQESLPPVSPEEAKRRLVDFKRELQMRIAGLPLDKPPAKQARTKKPRGKAAATTTNNSKRRNSDGETSAAVADEPPPLSPEKAERIDRMWNEYVASLPVEDAEATEDTGRETRKPGPRITLL